MNDSDVIIKPEIGLLDHLLREVAWGGVRIPRFQRPFVWKSSDIIELFDSVYRGYSIGSLLLWETDADLPSHDKIGPISLPTRPKNVLYVLDGHQRLAALFGCLFLPASSQEKEWQVWFNLEEKKFRYVSRNKPDTRLFPLRAILKTTDFLNVARQIEAAQPSKKEEFIEEAERLASRIKNYPISFNRIIGGDIDRAVNIFSRLNKAGTPISTDHMVSALTYQAEKLNLSQKIDDILEDLTPYGFGKLERSIVFQVVKLTLGLDIRQTDSDKVAAFLKKEAPERVDFILSDTQRAIVAATRFLKEDIGVVTPHLLPYAYQYLALSHFFYLCQKPNEQQRNLLQRWFWLTSFSAWFTGATYTEVSKVMTEIADIARGRKTAFTEVSSEEPAKAFPTSFNIRSTRVRTVMILLLKQHPRHPHHPDQILDPIPLLSEGGFQRIFPLKKLKKRANHKAWDHIANRILLVGTPEQSIQELLCAVEPDHREHILKSHAIPLEAYEDLVNENLEAFIEKRTAYLMQLEKEWMQRWEIIPSNETTDSPLIDADE